MESLKDTIISANSTLLTEPMGIKGTIYYVEGCISSNRARYYAKQLIEMYDLVGWFQIAVGEDN